MRPQGRRSTKPTAQPIVMIAAVVVRPGCRGLKVYGLSAYGAQRLWATVGGDAAHLVSRTTDTVDARVSPSTCKEDLSWS